MANNLYNAMNGQGANNNSNQLWQEVQRLKQTIQNPRAEVERLLQTGAMSQQKFNELAQQANKMFGK
jgi:hypothetical protein